MAHQNLRSLALCEFRANSGNSLLNRILRIPRGVYLLRVPRPPRGLKFRAVDQLQLRESPMRKMS